VINCTAGALQPFSEVEEIQVAIKQKKTMVAVLAPATRVGLSEVMGMPCGASCEA